MIAYLNFGGPKPDIDLEINDKDWGDKEWGVKKRPSPGIGIIDSKILII